MKNYRRFVSSLFVVALIMLLPACALAKPETVLRMCGNQPEHHFATDLMREVAAEIYDKTDGRIEVRVYPNGDMGDYTQIYDDLIRGGMDMALTFVNGKFNPRLEVDSFNGFVRNYAQAGEVFKAGGWLYKQVDAMHAKLGVKFLGFVVEGFTGIASVKPLKNPLSPDANKGVLARTPLIEPYRLAASAMGFGVVTIPYDEIRYALTNSDVDVLTGLSPTSAYTILKGVMKNWYQTNSSIDNESWLVSGKTWEKLSAKDRKIIVDACAAASLKSLTMAQAEDSKSIERMKRSGINVYTYTNDQLSDRFKILAGTWDKMSAVMGADFIAQFKQQFAPK